METQKIYLSSTHTAEPCPEGEEAGSVSEPPNLGSLTINTSTEEPTASVEETENSDTGVNLSPGLDGSKIASKAEAAGSEEEEPQEEKMDIGKNATSDNPNLKVDGNGEGRKLRKEKGKEGRNKQTWVHLVAGSKTGTSNIWGKSQ